MWPDNPIFVFSGPNCLPAGGEKRPGELEERPCEEDQNAGVRAEAREVSALPPTAASAHPQHTQIPQLVCNNCNDFYTPKNKFLPLRNMGKENMAVNKSTSAAPARSEHTPECSSLHVFTPLLVLCKRVASVWKEFPASSFLYSMRTRPMSQLVSAEAVTEWECQRDSPESSWCDVSGREHVLAWRLCLLSDADDSAPSSVEGQDGKGGERNSLSTQHELAAAAFFLQ